MGDGKDGDSEFRRVEHILKQVDRAVDPVLKRLDRMDADQGKRFDKIDDRLKAGDTRMQEHSDFIDDARPIIEEAKARRLLHVGASAHKKPRSKLPGWSIALLTASLGAIGGKFGDRVWTVFFSQPQAQASAPIVPYLPNPPALPATPTPPMSALTSKAKP